MIQDLEREWALSVVPRLESSTISRSQRVGSLSPKQAERMFDSFTRCDVSAGGER